MKKSLLSLFAMTLAVSAFAATEVTFNFDNDATALFGIEGRCSGNGTSYVNAGEFNKNGVATVDGVTITVEASAKDATNRNRLWASSPVLRLYNGTLTVAAPGHDISAIKFNAHATNFNMTANCGTLTDKNWTAGTEKFSTVVFTISKNTQIKSMTVTLDAEGPVTPPVVEIAGTGEGTVESPYDVERALSLIENEKVASTEVYVTGTVSSIEELNLDYGNATYFIAQGEKTLKIYRGYSYNGEKFTAEDDLKVGDVVVVCGKLVTDYGGQITTGSSIYSINGVTKEPEVVPPYTPVGDGTQANPYTVTDIMKMDIQTADGNFYWVKGYILGSASSATKLNAADKAADTNIALGETADAKTFIPVALSSKGEARTVLGVKTNPTNVGKEVMVLGSLEKYFSVAGVKEVETFVFEGKEYSGVETVAANDVNAPVELFDLQGRHVNNPSSGLYIRRQGNTITKVVIR